MTNTAKSPRPNVHFPKYGMPQFQCQCGCRAFSMKRDTSGALWLVCIDCEAESTLAGCVEVMGHV